MKYIFKGEHAAHLCAYARIAGGRNVITVAPRFFAQLLGEADRLPLGEQVWGITTVDMPFHQRDNQYTCTFTGKVLKPHQRQSGWCLHVAQVLAEFPVGLIIGENVQTWSLGSNGIADCSFGYLSPIFA